LKSEKVTLLLAVSEDPNNPNRWYQTWHIRDIIIIKFYVLIQQIINNIELDTHDVRYCFTIDNLNSYINNAFQALIFGSGHRLVFQTPYYLIYGTIKDIFNTI